MTNYKEIVTKAVISKGKRLFTTSGSVKVENPSNILGCWIFNHKYSGVRKNNDIIITGSYDIDIWYSCDNDSRTDIVREKNEYSEVIHMRDNEYSEAEVIVKCLKQPSCVKAYLDCGNINYTIEKEMGIELVDDVKVKIEAIVQDDVWDEIGDDNSSCSVEEIDDNFIKDIVI